MSLERKLLGRWHNGDLLPEEYMQLMKETKELLAQPDINTQYLLDQVARLTAENAMLKEKWLAQPKREPLSDGATADMYHANKKATHPDSYWSGVYDAEKAHGIGGGE